MKRYESRVATVEVLYFARLRETFGRERERVELPGNVTDVAGLTTWLRSRGEPWARELAPGRPVRIAVNQDMAAPDTPVGDGDEVAFFPPVTGG
jgi:molybdopterin synthase sulfur carrier subunit